MRPVADGFHIGHVFSSRLFHRLGRPAPGKTSLSSQRGQGRQHPQLLKAYDGVLREMRNDGHRVAAPIARDDDAASVLLEVLVGRHGKIRSDARKAKVVRRGAVGLRKG